MDQEPDDRETADRSEYFSEWYGENRFDVLAKRRDKYANDPDYAKKARESSRRYRDEVKSGKRVPGESGQERGPVMVKMDGYHVEARTVRHLAEGIGRSVQTINYWTKHGSFPDTPLKTPGGHRLYTDDMIEVVRSAVESRLEIPRGDLEFKREIVTGWRALGAYRRGRSVA